MKILITGTAGFIGYHLAKKLLERGDSVIGLDSINNYYDLRLKYARLADCGILKEKILENTITQSVKYPLYRFIKANLEDRDTIDTLFKKECFDSVCNLAAQAGVQYSIEEPRAYINSNIVGFLNILEACRGNSIKHLVYASSSSVYGLNKKMPFSTSHNVDHPISLYAATKKSNELMAHVYSVLYKLPTTGLRFFTVYGPWGRPDMALFLFTKAILEGKPISVNNGGEMKRDFTYIDDIVDGMIRVIDNLPEIDPSWNGLKPDPASSSAPYRIYNIGRGDPISLSYFIDLIESSINKKAIRDNKKIPLGDVLATWADTSNLLNKFNYKPITNIDVGVSRFVEWYRLFYNI